MACCGNNNKPYDVPPDRRVKRKKSPISLKENTVIKIDNGEGPIIV